MLFFKGYRGAPQFSVEHHGAFRTNVGIWFFSNGSWLNNFPWLNCDTVDEETMKAITKLPWWHDWKVNLRKKKWRLSKRLSTNLIPGSISADSSFFTIIYLFKFVHFPFSLFDGLYRTYKMCHVFCVHSVFTQSWVMRPRVRWIGNRSHFRWTFFWKRIFWA